MSLVNSLVTNEFQVVGIDIIDRDKERNSDEEDESNGNGGNEFDPVQEYVKIKWNLNAPFRDAPHPELKRDMYHLINSRFLADGIEEGRWAGLITEYMGLLAPGGWLQMVEFEWVFQSSRGRDLPHLEKWWNMYSGALRGMRRRKDPVIVRRLYHLMYTAGFERMAEERIDIPIGKWANGE